MGLEEDPVDLFQIDGAGLVADRLDEGGIEKIFRPPQQAKPQFEDKLGDIVVWNYYPKKQIEAARSGEFSGFTIDFREGKASKISPTWTVLK